MEKQLHGSQADLNQHSPLNVEHDGKTGSPEKELMGSQAPTSNSPIGLQEFDKNTLNGEMQLLGEQAPCDYHTAHHGWTSHDTPISKRAHEQSK